LHFSLLNVVNCRDGLAIHASEVAALEFSHIHGIRSAQVKLLEHLFRYTEAVNLYLESNQPMEALRIYRLYGKYTAAPNLDALLQALWREPSFKGGSSNKQSGSAKVLLKIVVRCREDLGDAAEEVCLTSNY
jgi:hypothetical protein